MDKYIHLQALLLKWLKHFNIRTIEQIRIASKSLCILYDIEAKNSVYKLLYPLLKRGFVEFIGDGKYQISSSVIIFYPKNSIAVGINITDQQKESLNDITYKEDVFGNIRFSIKHNDIEQLCKNIGCYYMVYRKKTPLVHFPSIKESISKFEEVNLIFENIQFYDFYKNKWVYDNKNNGIFRITAEGHIFYLKAKEQVFKIPSNNTNPEGWLLSECFQISCERNDFFCYDRKTRLLTVNKLNLPILVERILRMCSLYQAETVINNSTFQTSYPDISLTTIKQLNRIFDTKTKIING